MSRRTAPLSWVGIAVVAFATASVWGQGPNPSPRSKVVKGPLTKLAPAEPVWTVALDVPPSAGGAIDGAHIYVPLRPERFVALARLDGRTVWTRDIESATSPVVGPRFVYVLASDELHALEAATGAPAWRIPFPHEPAGAISLVGDVLVGVVQPSAVVAVSAADGTIRWRRELPALPAQPIVGDDRFVYATLTDGSVVALSLTSGEVVWQRTLAGMLSQPALVADRLMVGAGHDLFALRASNGEIAWRWRLGGDVVGAGGNLDTIFVVAMDNVLRAVNRSNGNQRWKKPISSRPARPPQLFGDLVVVSSASPTISVYDAVTGAPAGTYVAPAELAGPPLLAPAVSPSDVVMIVITRDGRVLGLHPTPPAPTPPPGRQNGPPTTTPRGDGPRGGAPPAGGVGPTPPPLP